MIGDELHFTKITLSLLGSLGGAEVKNREIIQKPLQKHQDETVTTVIRVGSKKFCAYVEDRNSRQENQTNSCHSSYRLR